MERKINIPPAHLKLLGLPEDTKGTIGIDANDCPSDCASLKINTQRKKVCKAVIVYTPEPTAQPKTKPKS